jgi:RNA polymerase sigma-70 factor, ECF subfamily
METPPQTVLVLAAQAGDQTAFETLVNAYRRELLVHCYRMLGSLADAEDLAQETLLRAWEKRTTLTSPESYRAWLYRIATNLCLNRLRSVSRRTLPSEAYPPSDPRSPAPPRLREPVWLEPFPDELLVDPGSDPEDQALRHERISLAFLVALQRLTPAQRAVLLLREVMEWPAVEVAEWLDLSVPAVNSTLQRARHALRQRSQQNGSEALVAQPRPHVQNLLDRYMTLWRLSDVPGLVALLREDAWLAMPPLPMWVQGRMDIATLLELRIFTPDKQWRLLPTRANGCPAFGLYRREAGEDEYQLSSLWVLEVEGEQIGSIVVFLDVASLTAFGLPPILEEQVGGQPT